MLSFFGAAAANLEPGESVVVANDSGDSYTVTNHGTHMGVTGNNQQSKDKLNAAYDDSKEDD